MGTAKERRERLQQIPEIIKAAGGKINFKTLYAKLAVKWGVRELTMREYLQTLLDVEMIRYDEDDETGNPIIYLVPEGEDPNA